MKTVLLIGSILLLGSLSPAMAQAKLKGGNQERQIDRFFPGIERLSEPEQQQLRAARDKALQTPEVQAAMVDRGDTAKDFSNVLQTALLAADDKLAPIVDKLKKKGRNLSQLGALAAGRGGPRADNQLADLTAEERQELGKAFAQTRNNPDLTAARDRMQTANIAMRTVMKKAMIKVDPTVEPLLAKLGPTPRPMNARRQAGAQ